MRRMTIALLLMLSVMAKGQQVSLSQALAYLNEQQEEWTITFVADELEGLMAAEAIEQQTGQAVPEAVERLTKDLPVKVKVKKALRQIYVQRKQNKESMTIQGKVVDSMTRNGKSGGQHDAQRPARRHRHADDQGQHRPRHGGGQVLLDEHGPERVHVQLLLRGTTPFRVVYPQSHLRGA